MSIVVTQEGAEQLWQQLFGIASIGYPNVHLFAASHAPAHTDTEATYAAIEAAVSGYAPISLTSPAANWTITPITAGAQATYVQIAWTFNGAVTIYGYWLADQTDSYSLFAEQFANPYVFGAGGGYFPLILPPTLTSTP